MAGGRDCLLWIINFMNLLNLYFLAGWLPTIVSQSYSVRVSQLVGTSLQVGGSNRDVSIFVGDRPVRLYPVLSAAFLTACVSIALIGQPALALTPLFRRRFHSGILHVGSQGRSTRFLHPITRRICARRESVQGWEWAVSEVSSAHRSRARCLRRDGRIVKFFIRLPFLRSLPRLQCFRSAG
jgi:hypothetical protein